MPSDLNELQSFALHRARLRSRIEMRKKHEAFAGALQALFIRHPLPGRAHEIHRVVRGSMLRKAREGGFADVFFAVPQWLAEKAEDVHIPPDELIAVYNLIYNP